MTQFVSDIKIQLFYTYFNFLDLVTFFLFLGVIGKSAQIFLESWLASAMEGPTPVSSLLHASTMIVSGVFLLLRFQSYILSSFNGLIMITFVGALTAFFAGTIGLVSMDLKRIIAYSTCSQMGYLVCCFALGNASLSFFHLVNHAFFKCLLFVAAGTLIHAIVNEQDIRLMGGVWKKLPYTWILMLIGTLALTGFPFLSGYYSKDAIIEFAYLKNSTVGFYAVAIGILTAVLTSIYSWRLLFKTFHGKYSNEKIKINEMHESPMVMLVPLILLGLGAIGSGFLFKDLFIGHESSSEFWRNSILFLNPIIHDLSPTWLLLLTPLLVIISIPISYYLFLKDKKILSNLVQSNKQVYEFLLNKWYFDELYDFIFVKPIKRLGLIFWKNGDIKTIDQFGPDGFAKLVKFFSNKAVQFQNGYIYHYAFVMLVGFSILLTYLILI